MSRRSNKDDTKTDHFRFASDSAHAEFVEYLHAMQFDYDEDLGSGMVSVINATPDVHEKVEACEGYQVWL